MHYLDKEQLTSNYLEVVVYFHEYKLGNIEFGVEIASIQKCPIFQPASIADYTETSEEIIPPIV